MKFVKYLAQNILSIHEHLVDNGSLLFTWEGTIQADLDPIHSIKVGVVQVEVGVEVGVGMWPSPFYVIIPH